MENKIPTAEEFLIRENLPTDILSGDDISIAMIEFAKLHVKAAIEECIESALSGSSTDTVSYEDVVECLKDCYPLDNIK
jgi:hypothetical protein